MSRLATFLDICKTYTCVFTCLNVVKFVLKTRNIVNIMIIPWKLFHKLCWIAQKFIHAFVIL